MLIYISEVLHYQFVHRKISTLTFGTHHVNHSKSAFVSLFYTCGKISNFLKSKVHYWLSHIFYVGIIYHAPWVSPTWKALLNLSLLLFLISNTEKGGPYLTTWYFCVLSKCKPNFFPCSNLPYTFVILLLDVDVVVECSANLQASGTSFILEDDSFLITLSNSLPIEDGVSCLCWVLDKMFQIYFKFSRLPVFPHISFLLLLTNKNTCEVRMICIKQHETETEQFLASCKIQRKVVFVSSWPWRGVSVWGVREDTSKRQKAFVSKSCYQF